LREQNEFYDTKSQKNSVDLGVVWSWSMPK